MTGRYRLQTRYARRYAVRAIADRGIRPASDCILACDRDPADNHAVILHVNSGGNAIASEQKFRSLGYLVDAIPFDGYGCKLRVYPEVAR